MVMTGCNPLSTQDDVAAAMATDEAGFEVYARHGVSDEEYVEHLKATLSCHPDLIIDDGGDLIALLHGECRAYGDRLIGGCEETTTGIHRLQSREAAGLLDYIGNLAPQLKNGITLTVAIFSFSSASVLVFIIAGTEQPKPIIIGRKALPESPNLRNALSNIKAILAI